MSPSETVNFSLEVLPEGTPPPAPDLMQPVDANGNPIKLGMFVDVYTAKVVGFRADPNNRLNVWVIPLANIIQTVDPKNPLNGQTDEKAVLVSGYHCSAFQSADIADAARTGILDKLKTKVKHEKDSPPPVVPLPSNFIAPDLA